MPSRLIQRVNKKIEKIAGNYRNMAQNSNRKTTSQKKRGLCFQKTQQLFVIAHQDANETMKSEKDIEEDIAFLDQRDSKEMMTRALDEKNKNTSKT